MTNRTGDAKTQLDRLADALVDDIMNASDEDILAETAEDGEDPKAVAAHMRGVIDRAMLDAGKAKMAAARRAVREATGRRAPSVVPLPLERKRALVFDALSENPQLRDKLTQAARKGSELSESDLDGMIEALRELGVISDDEASG